MLFPAIQPPPDPPARVAPAPPTAAQVAELEARYAPPRWGAAVAGPVGGYVRSYWLDAADPDVVVGQYVSGRAPGSTPGPARVRLLASAPQTGLVSDGGCAVVNVRYRLSTRELDARCGGR